MNTLIKLGLILISATLIGCSQNESKNNPQKTYTVHYDSANKSLFYTGNMQPLLEKTLTAPMDAVIESMPILFGQQVKKGEIIFTLNSSELQKQYNELLTEYLKAKDTYTIAETKFTGTQDLWNSGLISKNNYLSEKSTLNTSRIGLMQSAERLTDLLQKMGESDLNITTLSFANFKKVKSILGSRHSIIQIKAPHDGVLLYPPKNQEEKNTHLGVGSPVKAGQVLGLIGDLSGVRVEIDIPEVDIEKVKPGTKAIIKSIAVPNGVLTGQVVAINSQASNNSNGSLPSFSAVVEVKKLSSEQRQWVRVGLSADIELSFENQNKLVIPLAAIKQEQGKAVVEQLDPKGHKVKKVIETGATKMDRVTVENGLEENDTILMG